MKSTIEEKIGTVYEDVTTDVLGTIGVWQWLVVLWLVFCDDKLKMMSTAIIFRMGLMFGYIFSGLIADRLFLFSFGRKTALFIDVLIQLCMGVIITLCDSEGWFRLLIFLKSLLGSATTYIGLVLMCEISSNSWRSSMNMIVMLPRLFAMICGVPLANSSPNLETYSFISSAFGALLLILLRWIPESPQWLLYNRKTSNAEQLLFAAAKRNNIKLCDDFRIRPVNQRSLSRNLLSLIAISSCLVEHALLLNITPRLFAIKIRATLLGFCHAAGQLGAMISYLLFLLQPMNDGVVVALELGVTLTLVFLRFTILDVDGRELPDTMEDMDYFSELSKPLRATQKTNSPSNEEVEMRVYSYGSAGRISQSQSEERLPAQRTGFNRIGRVIVRNFNLIFRPNLQLSL
ncbi:LOW QUALITY PROTEIN: solute carrier family 22 member 7-like [Aphomia sociella]